MMTTYYDDNIVPLRLIKIRPKFLNKISTKHKLFKLCLDSPKENLYIYIYTEKRKTHRC